MLSYGLKDLNDKLVYLSVSEFDTSQQSLLEWIRSHNLNSENFASVDIIWEEPRAVLVPKSYYLEAKKEVFAKVSFDISYQEILLNEELESEQIIFPVNQDLYYSLRSKFPKARHKSGYAENIKQSLNSTELNHGINVFFSESFLQIVHCEDGKLQFSNAFPFSSESEAAYYILNYFEQGKLDRNTTPLSCSGIDPQNEISRLLAKYLAKLNFYTVQLDEELNKAPGSHPFIHSF